MNQKDGRRVAETALDAIGRATEFVVDGELLAVEVTLVVRGRDGRVCVLHTTSSEGDGSAHRTTAPS